MSTIELLALGAVLLIGIPHGGLDAVIARRHGWPMSFPAWASFHLLYLFLALLVILLWQQLPLLTLGSFLIISGIHFARSDCDPITHPRRISLIAHGGLVPIAIPYAQANQVQPIFTLLVGETNTLVLLNIVQLLLLPWVICVALYGYHALRDALIRKAFFALVGLIIAALVFPPLVTFALYFCILHSPRHMRSTFAKLSLHERKRGIIEMIVYSIIAIMAIVIGAIYFQNDMQLGSKLIQFSFIGIAALTVPHMLLVDYGAVSKMRFAKW